MSLDLFALADYKVFRTSMDLIWREHRWRVTCLLLPLLLRCMLDEAQNPDRSAKISLPGEHPGV